MNRMPFRCVALALGAVLAASAAHGGTVYVPLPGVTTVGGQSFETEVVITNAAAAGRQVNTFLLPAGTNGTDRDGLTPQTVGVAAGAITVVEPPASTAGLLELTGGSELTYTARLVGLGAVDALGTPLPAIGSHNAVAAGSTAVVAGLGWTLAGTRGASIGLVNLDVNAANCSVEIRHASGAVAITAATITVPPLAHATYALGTGSDVTEARAVATCNRRFYLWAWTTDTTTGDVATILSGAPGTSTLAPPGQGGCPAGAVCFAKNGLLHQPTKATPVGRVTFPMQAMVARRIHMEMDVTVGAFYPKDPDGKHLIYWFVVNNNQDMPGMLFFRGPQAYSALARHGIRLGHPDKKKLVDRNFEAQTGRTYHVVNDYDMAGRRYTITITDKATGAVRSTMTGTPNVTSYTFDGNDSFIVDMGFPEGKVPDEVPSYGWQYANVAIQVIP